MENNQETERKPKNSLTIGIRNQETSERFIRLNAMRNETYERTVSHLLDLEDGDAGSGELLGRIEQLQGENRELNAAVQERDGEIADLNKRLEAAVNEANANAESGLDTCLKLEELRIRIGGAIVIKPNPVTAYFLEEMAKRTGSTPERILEELFIADLQNPTVNNLPYTVTSREIREAVERLKSERQ